MIKLLDQTTNRDMMHACTIYTQLHILMFDYNIRIEDSMIFKLVYYMEKLGKIVLTEWAYFNVIYPAVAAIISWYYGIKLEVRKNYISQWLNKNYWYWIGYPKYSLFRQRLWTDDWVLSKADIDKISEMTSWGWHNVMVKWNQDKYTLIDSWDWVYYSVSEDVLQYAVEKWVFWDTARTITSWDTRTEAIRIECKNTSKKLKRLITIEEFKAIVNKHK